MAMKPKSARPSPNRPGKTAPRPRRPGADPLAVAERQGRRADGGIPAGTGRSQGAGAGPGDRHLQLHHRADPQGDRDRRCRGDRHQPGGDPSVPAEPSAGEVPAGQWHPHHRLHEPGLWRSAEGPGDPGHCRPPPGHPGAGCAGLGAAAGLLGHSVVDQARQPGGQP
ncbi:hypothetical protein G6F68_015161 [Rhizopus microsporus]|nr:hypothetical protein G6F68_015161 [Rhizopus microsporus]